MHTIASIENKLTNELNPSFLSVKDESHKHASHGNFTGVSHVYIEISSEKFSNIPKVKQHQLIYKTLAEELANGLHAVRIGIV